eukprot:INCI1892.1.p1 GENE.INCI1892.1~~INCI1892.1.p1  ORF type:complete len:309 (-),score=54.17 INCI1892.1:2466-3392(-)
MESERNPKKSNRNKTPKGHSPPMPRAWVGGAGVAALLVLAIALWWELAAKNTAEVTLQESNSANLDADPSLHAVPVFAAHSYQQRQDVATQVDISRPFVLRECSDKGATQCSKFFHTFQEVVVPGCLEHAGPLDFRQQVGRALFRNVNFDMADASGIHVDDFRFKAMAANDFASGKVSCDEGAFCYTSEPVLPGCAERRTVDLHQIELYQAIMNASAATLAAWAKDASTPAHAIENDNDALLALTAAGASEIFKENVWVGSAGVIALTHYDQVHNFFTQLQGRKRFILVRPSFYVPVCGSWQCTNSCQ